VRVGAPHCEQNSLRFPGWRSIAHVIIWPFTQICAVWKWLRGRRKPGSKFTSPSLAPASSLCPTFRPYPSPPYPPASPGGQRAVAAFFGTAARCSGVIHTGLRPRLPSDAQSHSSPSIKMIRDRFSEGNSRQFPVSKSTSGPLRPCDIRYGTYHERGLSIG